MKWILLIGRILYVIIFLMTITTHFSGEMVDYARSKAVPMASILVPVSGIIAFLGALSILIGFKAKWGAWLIIVFLVPVTLMMHAFWNETDPMQEQIQTIMFLKNISMLGGAMIIAYFGSGPLSVDGKISKR